MRTEDFDSLDIDAAIGAFARSLTDREREVIRLIFRGYSSKAVARQMQIAVKTEKVHRRNAYQKLGVGSQAELFAAFLCFLAADASRARRAAA